MYKLFKTFNNQAAAIRDIIAANIKFREELDSNCVQRVPAYTYLKEHCTLALHTGQCTGITTSLVKMITDDFFGMNANIFLNPRNKVQGNQFSSLFSRENFEIVPTSIRFDNHILKGKTDGDIVFIFTEYNLFHVDRHRQNFVDQIFEALSYHVKSSAETRITILFFSS